MKKIKLTQGKVALVDDGDFEYLNQFRWQAVKGYTTYYASRAIRINGKRTSMQMHREILNTPKGVDVDHVNHDGLDNQRVNIRICNKSQNAMNRNSYKNSSSKFKGVFLQKYGKKWKAQLRYKGENNYLGHFLLEEDAALAYNKKAIEIFGGFAKLN